MNKILGFATHSIISVQQNLQDNGVKLLVITNKNKLFYRTKNFKKLKNSDIILFDSMNTFNSLLPIVNKVKSTVAIFDSPLNLYQLENIELVDVNTQTDPLKYEFNVNTIDYEKLLSKHKFKSNDTNTFKFVKDVALESIIKNYSSSGLMDKFNTYLYQASRPTNRPAVRNILVKYIFGELKSENLLALLGKQSKTAIEHKAMLFKIIEFIESKAGTQLRKALQDAKTKENAADNNTRRTIAYKQLADKYNVDKFELRNLILLYRNIKSAR